MKRQSTIINFFNKKTKTDDQNELESQSDLQTNSATNVSDTTPVPKTTRCASVPDLSTPEISVSGDRIGVRNDENTAANTKAAEAGDISKSLYNSPSQPQLQVFPATSGRRFSANYYKMFCWVEYSAEENSVYCFSCRHFCGNRVTKGSTSGRTAFIDYGIKKWQKLKALLLQHEASEKHKTSILLWSDFKKIQEGSIEPVVNIMNTGREKEIQENREHIIILLKAIRYLGRQKLAFRGHDESENSLNKGNFLELVDALMEDKDSNLRNRLSSRYGHYTSPECQNDLIRSFALSVRDAVISKIQNYFSIMVDETKDLSKKEQLSFSLRFIDERGTINERCIACYHVSDLDAESLFRAIENAVTEHGLQWSKCVAQCYDGASVMSGKLSGVQARVKEVAPHCTYIHCHAHRLNLCLVYAIQSNNHLENFFNIVQKLYKFLSVSNTRHQLFIRAQQDQNQKVLELERCIETRWAYWYSSVGKILQRFKAIVVTLTLIKDNENDGVIAAEAEGLLSQISSRKFVVTLIAMEKILGKINTLSRVLQDTKLILPSVVELIESTKQSLIQLRRDEEWNLVLEETKNLISASGLSDVRTLRDGKRSRQPVISKKLTSYFVSTTLGKKHGCSDQELKSEMFFLALDTFMGEINKRFDNKPEYLKAVSLFDPASSEFLEYKSAEVLIQNYPLIEIDEMVIKSELETAKVLLKTTNVSDTFEVRAELKKLSGGFTECLKLIELILALPVTTATNERFFSTLKIVKNHLRTSCSNDRLSDLLVLATHQDIVKSLDLNIPLDKFAKMKPRRYPLLL